MRLFLTDVNEALVFDPDNNELAFALPTEPPHAESMLIDYLNEFFYLRVNGEPLALDIKSKRLSGEGQNTALGLLFVYPLLQPPKVIEIHNAVFTDLFYDQTNIVYLHYDDESDSLMLNKKTPTHTLAY